MTKGVTFFAAQSNYGLFIDLYVRDQNGGKTSIMLPTKFKVVEDLNLQTEPAMSLQPHEAQNLMDTLWAAGVRPTNGEGSTGQLAATERHLNDMRDIANHLLKRD